MYKFKKVYNQHNEAANCVTWRKWL